MSERSQHTAAALRDRMLQRYGDERHHKHDKSHVSYRQHCRSHPVTKLENGLDTKQPPATSTGLVRETNLRKFRRSMTNGRIH